MTLGGSWHSVCSIVACLLPPTWRITSSRSKKPASSLAVTIPLSWPYQWRLQRFSGDVELTPNFSRRSRWKPKCMNIYLRMLYPIAILIPFNSSRTFAFLDRSSMDSMMNVKVLMLRGLKNTMESAMVHHRLGSAHLIRLVPLVILWMRMTQMMTQVAKVAAKMILIWSIEKPKEKCAMKLFQCRTTTSPLTTMSWFYLQRLCKTFKKAENCHLGTVYVQRSGMI